MKLTLNSDIQTGPAAAVAQPFLEPFLGSEAMLAANPFAKAHPVIKGFLEREDKSLSFGAYLQERNTRMDFKYYDVPALTKTEIETLRAATHLEGSIIVVEPMRRGLKNGTQRFDNYETFRAEPGDLMRFFTISGVGSSDIGAAALARNLANVVKQPVGAIVAGYGVADLTAEGLGGWFWLGAQNRMYKALQDSAIEEQWLAMESALGPFGAPAGQMRRMALGAMGGPDSDALLSLMLDEGREIEVLVGHSKGCLSLAHALRSLIFASRPKRVASMQNTDVITLGAVVALPKPFTRVVQYLGDQDRLGKLNSLEAVPHEIVPGAGHSLNREDEKPLEGEALMRKAIG